MQMLSVQYNSDFVALKRQQNTSNHGCNDSDHFAWWAIKQGKIILSILSISYNINEINGHLSALFLNTFK